ncbi:unnamed protein product [Pseudo-nitzschia multistriata]|uniref:Swiss Army Knife protein DSP-PTPase phosphatase domain-containing protein n=1 Tax=Pseudo-nitzschia multistriata TaxID=183589 RepID=A0A448Z2H5_9STRA|nr:unnamed protein product [Pseudo-nitzschia multistriata]
MGSSATPVTSNRRLLVLLAMVVVPVQAFIGGSRVALRSALPFTSTTASFSATVGCHHPRLHSNDSNSNSFSDCKSFGAAMARWHSTSGRRTTSLFESVANGYYRNTNSDEIPLEKLLQKASGIVRDYSRKNRNSDSDSPAVFSLEALGTQAVYENTLFFPSFYNAGVGANKKSSPSSSTTGMTERGFSNWILPGKIMVGQYPGRVPEKNTPTETEVRAHLGEVLEASRRSDATTNGGVCFVSLQSELPPQDDYDSWKASGGEIYLEGDARSEWPNPFSHYAPTVEWVRSRMETDGDGDSAVEVQYLHHPIRDLSVPSNSKHLRLLLWKILEVLDNRESDGSNSDSMVYIHCWGGRGRAGLTACCLLALLHFASEGGTDGGGNHDDNLSAIFDIVQTGYDSRLGSEHMPLALSRSPQTDSQRAFVAGFYGEVRAAAAEAGKNGNAK